MNQVDVDVIRKIKAAKALMAEAAALLKKESDRLYELADQGAPKGIGTANHQGNIHADAWVSVTRTLKAMESGTDHIEHALNKFPAIE